MKIITFYSYKGGVGRTMCLANIAVLLAKWGHKVLMVDWDWEAPGLERYFVTENFNGKAQSAPAGLDLKIVKKKPGLIDLLTERKKNSWKEALITIPVPDARESLHLISAGRRDDDYFKRVRDFNVDTFYAKKKGGQYIEDLRSDWRDAYDFVLIDSRTGVTEVNGISTIQMPNLVVLLFTPNNQSFEGILDIAHRSSVAQQKLPYDRTKLLFLPILSRLESTTELDLTNDWVTHFAAEGLMDFYKYWLPTLNERVKPAAFLMLTKIPHVSYYTFGEKLAVVKDGTSNPTSMGYAYEGIASLIANKLEEVEMFVEQRDRYIGWAGGFKTIENDTKSATPKFVIIYDIADSLQCELLNKHLNVLKITKKIRVCNVNKDITGSNVITNAKYEMADANYLVVLVTANLMTSEWFKIIYTALEAGQRIIPIRIHKVDVDGTGLERLRSLPSLGRTVDDFPNADAAYSDIVTELKKLLPR